MATNNQQTPKWSLTADVTLSNDDVMDEEKVLGALNKVLRTNHSESTGDIEKDYFLDTIRKTVNNKLLSNNCNETLVVDLDNKDIQNKYSVITFEDQNIIQLNCFQDEVKCKSSVNLLTKIVKSDLFQNSAKIIEYNYNVKFPKQLPNYIVLIKIIKKPYHRSHDIDYTVIKTH